MKPVPLRPERGATAPASTAPIVDAPAQTLSDRTRREAQQTLDGKRRGLAAFLPFVGPAVVSSIAYVDPGNYATNIKAGAQFGYLLLWVVVLANLIAMLFQGVSAKLGIVTDLSLAEQCRERFARPLVYFMWIASEMAAMATDLAEFLGAAIGLSLLFGLPLFVSLIVVGIATYAMLLLEGSGFRPLELLIGGFVAVISVCYLLEMLIAPPQWPAFFHHLLLPELAGPESITLAVGILGATVMPHAIYLHSNLTQNRILTANDGERRRVVRYSNIEVVAALGVAGLVNLAMISVSAAAFHEGGHQDVGEIETAYKTLIPLLGAGAATIFLLSVLASGLSSSVVGTMAGQRIMQDFVHVRIPLWVRRLVTMAPSFVVVGLGIDKTQALIASQVVLSLFLPIPMIALLVLSGRRDVMGEFANTRITTILMLSAAVAVVGLNGVLIAQTLGVRMF